MAMSAHDDGRQPPDLTQRDTASVLAHDVVAGVFDVGELMPSEHSLAQRFHVSRPVIRQALARLASAGLTETRHGVGSFVRAKHQWNLLDTLVVQAFHDSGNVGAIAEELVDVRRVVEIECATLAAPRITAADLRQLKASLERLEVVLDDVALAAEADLAFHDVIIQASGNRFLIGLTELLRDLLHEARIMTMNAGGPTGRKQALEHHRAIYEGLAQGDADATRQAMRSHMDKLETDTRRSLIALDSETTVAPR